jgi:hypothetical protein
MTADSESRPRLRTTREHAARKIAECIHGLEQLRDAMHARGPQELEDEFELQRHYAVELLLSLFVQASPAETFDRETKRSVYYTNSSEEERRQAVRSEIREAIKQLRSVTITLTFYEEPQASPPALTRNHGKDQQPSPAPTPTQQHMRPFGVLLGTLVLLIGLLVWQIPRIHQYNLGVVTYVILVIAALVSALVLFSFLQSTAELTGHHLGFSIRLGGAAALFFIVLLTGLHFRTADTPPRSDTATTGTTAAPPSTPALGAGDTTGTTASTMSPAPNATANIELTFEVNTDRFGNDYREVWNTDSKRCREECLRDPRCQAYTFDGNQASGAYRRCYLKSAPGTPVEKLGDISGVKRQSTAISSPSSQTNQATVTMTATSTRGTLRLSPNTSTADKALTKEASPPDSAQPHPYPAQFAFLIGEWECLTPHNHYRMHVDWHSPSKQFRGYLTKQGQTSENLGFRLGDLVWIVEARSEHIFVEQQKWRSGTSGSSYEWRIGNFDIERSSTDHLVSSQQFMRVR